MSNNITRKDLFFTFVSDGTPHEFSAFSMMLCPFQQKKRYAMDVYRDWVAHRNSPTVYILDNTGNILGEPQKEKVVEKKTTEKKFDKKKAGKNPRR